MPEPGLQMEGTHTLAEILSQPDVWRVVLDELSRSSEFRTILQRTSGRTDWLFVGCGTSFYLAEAAASSWSLITGQRARALPASDVLLFPQLAQLDQRQTQAVVISRSGRTSEALRAAEILSQVHLVPTLGITCTSGSELARVCDVTMTLDAADEKSMVMTRSFSSMLLGLLHLGASHMNDDLFLGSLERAAANLATRIGSFNASIESLVANHSFEDYVYLAQGPLFPIAREAALKITEMSCSYAQSYHTLEFRHGPKSIVSPRTCLTFFLSESGMPAESEVLSEMKGLGAVVIAICNRASDTVRRSSDLVLELEADIPELALQAPFIAPAQLLGFHLGVQKGFNPDEPRNLSRVVILD